MFEGFHGALNWTTMMPRDAIVSGTAAAWLFHLFPSVTYLNLCAIYGDYLNLWATLRLFWYIRYMESGNYLNLVWKYFFNVKTISLFIIGTILIYALHGNYSSLVSKLPRNTRKPLHQRWIETEYNIHWGELTLRV